MISNKMIVDGLKQALTTAFKTWLDENRDAVLRIVAQAVAPDQSERTKSQTIDKAPKRFLTTQELAARWNFHPATVLRLLRTGALPSLRINRRRVMVAITAVEEYERRNMLD